MYTSVTVHLHLSVSGIRRSSAIVSVPRFMDIRHNGLREMCSPRSERPFSIIVILHPTNTTVALFEFFDHHGQWRRYPCYWWLRARRKSYRTRYQHRARGFAIREEAGRDLDLRQFQRWRPKVESISLHLVDVNAHVDESLLGMSRPLANCLKSTSLPMLSTSPP